MVNNLESTSHASCVEKVVYFVILSQKLKHISQTNKTCPQYNGVLQNQCKSCTNNLDLRLKEQHFPCDRLINKK